jgi:hypothetical protein
VTMNVITGAFVRGCTLDLRPAAGAEAESSSVNDAERECPAAVASSEYQR